MKKFIFILSVAFLATVLFNACEPKDPSGNDEYTPTPQEIGVEINGVVWAPYNVGKTGKFVNKPEDYGGLYQWNRKDSANFLFRDAYYYESGFSSADSWLSANDPSPKGWRVPTMNEIATLLDTDKVKSEWIETENGVFGREFMDITTNKSIFLPAAGYRSENGGVLYSVGTHGNYWSSNEKHFSHAYYLLFDSEYVRLDFTGGMAMGNSIRPVAK